MLLVFTSLHCAQAKRAHTAPSFLHQIRRRAHRWKANNISNVREDSNCCTVHERVRSMHFCAMSVCMSSTRSRPRRDLIATWVDDHRRDRDATHWPWFAMLSRHCHDLNRTIATVHDKPETLHNPLVWPFMLRHGLSRTIILHVSAKCSTSDS
jgi:hypothetical protein